jgi:hypothetical protein
MAAVRADRREIQWTPDPEGERLVHELAEAYLELRLKLARELLRLDRGGAFNAAACSSIVQYAVRLRIPAPEARMLVDLGRALDPSAEIVQPAATASATDGGVDSAAPVPSVEERVRSGQLPVENAALVGRLLAEPGLVLPGEDWLLRAESLPTTALRRWVNQRIEQAAQGEPQVVTVAVAITQRARDDFARARVVASREAGVALTEGQAFTLIVRHYLDAKDEMRRGAGTRRVGPTSQAPEDRYIPADVRRQVLERSGDRCEVPGCDRRVFLAFAHDRSHAEGGDREAENLLRLCDRHHTQLDADVLHLAGWRDGRPAFRDARGQDLGSRPILSDTADASGGRSRAEHPPTAEADWTARATQVSERPPPAWVTACG